jgi:hypothetical protein
VADVEAGPAVRKPDRVRVDDLADGSAGLLEVVALEDSMSG